MSTKLHRLLPLWEMYIRCTTLGKKIWCNFASLAKKLKVFRTARLLFGKLLKQLLHFYATGQIAIVVNGQRLNSIIDIWSHC